LLDLLLLATIAALASPAHAGICVGLAVGSGIMSRNRATTLYAAMIVLGALIEGFMMRRAVFNTSTCVLVSTIAMSIAPSFIGIPLSLNFGLYTSQIGCSLGLSGLSIMLRLAHMCFWWILFLTATGFSSLLLQRALEHELARSRAPLTTLKRVRIAIVVLTLLLSFVVGANTFGFIIAFSRSCSQLSLGLLCASIALPALCFSSKSVEKVAYRFYRIRLSNAITTLIVSITILEIATLMSVPLPASLTITTAIYFAGMAARFRYMSARTYLQYVTVQCIAIPLALGLGYAISLVLG